MKRSFFTSFSNIVLLVEDSSHIQNTLSFKLRLWGLGVLSAKNGQEGLHVLRNEKPDVVLTDIRMPRMDGITMYQKARMENFKVPFVFVVSLFHTLPLKQRKLIEQAIVVPKPFSDNEMLHALSQTLIKPT